MKELYDDFKELCEKHDIKNAVIGYEDENRAVGTSAIGSQSSHYEIVAVLFGFFKSAFHEHIGDLIDGGKKK